jgi:hypothetical protein
MNLHAARAHENGNKTLVPVARGLLDPGLLAETPKLDIRTRNGLPQDVPGKQRMEYPARHCELGKYTTRCDIWIERDAIRDFSSLICFGNSATRK